MFGIKKLFFILILIIVFAINSLFALGETTDSYDNYLLGMTVTKTYSNNYYVRLKLSNETEQRLKLKDMGNNSYTLILPQVKSLINEDDIYYENSHSGIKIIFSEKRDLSDNNKYYTKINFKTINNSVISVEAYTQKTSKTQAVLKKDVDENQNNDNSSFPIWVWLLPAAILSVLCIILMIKSSQNDKYNYVNDGDSYVPQENYEFEIKENDTSVSEGDENIMKDENKQNEEIKEDDEVNNIVDELVKVIIPKNDLVLMPGVPELPGLEKSLPKINIYDVQKTIEKSKIPTIPEKMSFAERIKTKNLMQEADDIIFEEKEMFFENISPIKDVSETAEGFASDRIIEREKDEYEKLLDSMKLALREIHNVQDTSEIPEIIDAFAIDENTGFSLVKYGDKVSFAGNINQNIFVIKTFETDELKNDTLYMEFCTQSASYATYSVVLNKFKALLKVTDSEISLIGEYT